MKRSIVALLLLMSAGLASAQKIRFTDATNQWNVFTSCICDPPPNNEAIEQFGYQGTVTVNNVTYQKIKGIGSSYIYIPGGLVREDTAAHKVYFRAEALGQGNPYNDTLERILYDYNWVVGSQIYVQLPNFQSLHTVTALDSTRISGVWHKIWTLTPGGGFPYSKDYKIIEGIGCLDYPLFPLFPHFYEEASFLRCFNQGTTQPSPVPAVGYFDNGTSCSLAVGNEPFTRSGLLIMPQPVTTQSKMVLPEKVTQGHVAVYNVLGQLVLSADISHTDVFDLGTQISTPGRYFVRVGTQRTSTMYTGTFWVR